ncbi:MULTISPECIES: YafY family protein [Parafrankia]|uniref:WYL domain-containing protein n=1 Tax=Parafrankia soli TaxID=2599596 RepID=A0A1S1Q5A8_9ACTN|nr:MULTISPECIES: WYL domain-containing protein [Parafrankia]OHV28385.1 WYL domain-containing protein [Parafrankia soli]TCJ33046.1 WYL domain-containing protein [Parafrankia sp. BMG5.11]SQD98956.1 Protein PafC [Parafrankia sp. Ea1.12]
MSGSTDRFSRLLALVPWLRAHPGVSLEAAAAEFDVTVRQLRDDLDLLFVCGLPGGAPGDLIDVSYSGDQVTVVDPQTLDRPLRLSADEATALLVAARALTDVPGLVGREALDQALRKVEDAVGNEPAGHVRVALDTHDEVLAILQGAIRDRRRVRLRYLVWSRDEMTVRDVDPMRVLVRDGHWYLEGWCHRASAVRLFRLDRIDGRGGAVVLDVVAQPPPTATPRDTADGVYRPGPDDIPVRLDLEPQARWVVDYYPVSDVCELPDGGVSVLLRVSEPSWLNRLVLGLGAQVRRVEPASVAARVHELADRALAAYAEEPIG